MSITSYNGSAIIAMAGRECVGVAVDTALTVQYLAVAHNFQRMFMVNDRTCLALSGLATDVQTLYELLRMKTNLYKLEEERDMGPKKFAHLVSSTLYERRFGPFFCEPIIAGLEKDGTPYIGGLDTIGCIEKAADFAVGGTAASNLYGVAESLWEPGLEPEDLFETISQTIMSGVYRDCLSGWGCIVKIITKDRVITRSLKTRMN